MVATAFLSGLFGMAGGLILIGVLLTILPLPSAMVLHAITQPLMDTFFLGGQFDRRGIVATKATCQVASHFVKLIHFGGLARSHAFAF